MIQLKNINIQINTSAMLSKLDNNITVVEEKENAIVLYDESSRKDIFYFELTDENKIVWDNYINMCINKVSISKIDLGQIINQYTEERIILNTVDIFVESSSQYIIQLSELSANESLILTNFNEMIKNNL